MFGFQKLDVWNKTIELADDVYRVTRGFPDYEKFALASQMRRAVVSLSSNIAEGSGRSSTREFVRFVQIAYGSLMELVSQMQVCERQSFVAAESAQRLYEKSEEVARMLSGLKSSLERREEMRDER